MAGREGENFADEKEVNCDDDFGEVELGNGKGRWRGLRGRLGKT
jgi:hypothetical protein